MPVVPQDYPDLAIQALQNIAAPVASVPALVSGTAFGDATGRESTVYVPITGAAGGTYSVAIGPTNAVAIALATAAVLGAGVSTVVTVKLPAGWFIKVTVASGAAIGAATQIAQ